MFDSNSPNSDLLRSILGPLLEDFQYWFGRSRLLLETETLPFLSAEKRADLLARVSTAQQEVSTAQMLLKVTDGQVGIETSVMKPWHDLVGECWQVAVRLRLQESGKNNCD
ncbi:DUF2605 domain-containing protein [Stenomitos frigidus]|uniref:DUF2605 domain-containing protein n=1 Tax=Stenomitos frigidus ULC18 TaxID=2107698 RepID=A0A2T1DWA6_9CYAN|nr:DUF2605 domain-containing protein [Stenomitos frigidus]PSB24770.1 DUF2605 domain-containing protein [Stenomitos frigidus ULC18]